MRKNESRNSRAGCQEDKLFEKLVDFELCVLRILTAALNCSE